MTTTRARRRKLTGVLASLALSLLAMTSVSGAAQASETYVPQDYGYTDSPHGCPRGAVCIYPGAGWNGGNPTYVFWSYGVHLIYNQYGQHRIYNNQTHGARAGLCMDTGSDCGNFMPAGFYADYGFTPINAIKLRPAS